MQQTARTTIVDRNASIVPYSQLKADEQAQHKDYRDTTLYIQTKYDAMAMCELMRLPSDNWHGGLTIGVFGGFLVHLRDDGETAIVAWQTTGGGYDSYPYHDWQFSF